jgi:hypothetical protein
MKATLQLDPTVDILANGLPNAFLRRAAHAGKVAGARQHAEQIRRLAAGLTPDSALVIFPEGGNWTPLRWHRAADRLRRAGRPDLAERAAAMPNVLPPRAAGALAAIAACPQADVVFVAHTGLDRLVSVRDVWRSLLTDMEVRARWWRVPAASVARSVSRDAQVTWLYDWWARIDAWITEENPLPSDTAAVPAQLASRGAAVQVVLPGLLQPGELDVAGPPTVGPPNRPRGHDQHDGERREPADPQPPVPVGGRVGAADKRQAEQCPGGGPPQRHQRTRAALQLKLKPGVELAPGVGLLWREKLTAHAIAFALRRDADVPHRRTAVSL